jgi:exopolysaccharide production protein ExoZ
MRLTSLHFLRAIGAIFIVVSHSHGLMRKRFESLGFTDTFWQIEQGYTKVFGAIGVDLFLVLAGFFAFYTTWNRNNGAIGFLTKRLIRIYPIWWVALLLLVLMSFVPGSSGIYSLSEIYNSVILNPIYIDGQIKPILEIGWTLHYIVFYYLAITFLMSIRLDSINVLKILTLLFITLSTVGIYVNTLVPIVEVITNPRTLAFALGGWLAFILLEKPIKWGAWHTGIALLVLALLIVLFVFFDEWRLNAPTLLSRSSIAVLIILLFVFEPKLKTYNFHKVFNVCGNASYSIYLFHMFPLMVFSGLWKRDILLPPDFLHPFLIWLALIFLGVISGVIAYRLFEQPMFRYLNNKIIKQRLNKNRFVKEQL